MNVTITQILSPAENGNQRCRTWCFESEHSYGEFTKLKFHLTSSRLCGRKTNRHKWIFLNEPKQHYVRNARGYEVMSYLQMDSKPTIPLEIIDELKDRIVNSIEVQA